MSLDLGETILQLDQVSENLGRTYSDRQARLHELLRAAAQISPEVAIEKTSHATDRPYMAAQVVESLLGSYTPPPPPQDWSAISVDGSHIDVDRHLPVPCYLLNLGGCILTYGSQPDAQFFSQPQLAADPTELYLTDPASPANEEAVTGPLLGIVRTVRELERLVAVVQECPPDQPTLALVDGTLVLWGLSGQVYKPFVRKAILEEGLLLALDRLKELAQSRPITLAAYVSLPRTTEVANAIRCCLCPHDLSRCRESCSYRRATLTPCETANGFLDRDLFQQTLEPGWRSSLFISNPAVANQEYYGEHQVYFYYLHAGEEIARVEVPRWVAQDDKLLSLGHSLIVEQCRRGQGYPVAISEAHEQAVINGSDRQLFKQMITEVLERQGLPTYTSEKERSKRSPWV
ncbi:MAG: DNA double-strand break repair nuclease NurA [Dehalococcoidia bacterium]